MEVTDEMIYAFAGEPEVTATDAHAITVGLRAVLAIVERDLVKPGPCMNEAPQLIKGQGLISCSLLAGHAGGHTNGVSSWGERWDRAPIGTQWPEGEAEQGTASAADKPMNVDLCGQTFPEGWGEPADPSPCDLSRGHLGAHSNGTQSWRLVSETAHRSVMDTTDVPR